MWLRLVALLTCVAGLLAWTEISIARAEPGDPIFRAEARAPSDETESWVADAADSSAKRERTDKRAIEMSDFVQLVTTARRRQELVQLAPVAVTSLGTDSIEVSDVRRVTDLDGLVPNLAIDSAIGSANSGRLAIRGVSQGAPAPSFDPAVGVYVDGVYTPRLQGLLEPLFDVERVEVVRGPQGTLFGKNTIGGTINVTTRKPEFELAGEGSVRLGNYHRMDTRGMINVPLVPERAAARVSFATNYDDGYQKNVFFDKQLATDRVLAGRGQLLLLPQENLEVLLSGDYAREDRRPQGAKCKVVGPLSPGIATLQNIVTGNNPAAFDILGSCAEDAARSDFKTASDLAIQRDDFRTTRLTSQISWEPTDTFMVRSITSFRNQDQDVRQDFDGTLLSFAQPVVDAGQNEQRAFSQELQASGRASSRLEYVFGVYAFNESVDERIFGGAFAGAPVPAGFLAPFLPQTREVLKVDNSNFSAYGQLTYALTDQLSVSAGLRRTVERKRIDKRETTLNASLAAGPAGTERLLPILGVPNFERSERFDDFSPNASLSYQWQPNVLVYMSYATGFRSGGFNGRLNAANPDFFIADPEDLTTYETGFKSTFLDNRVLLNFATFYSIYEDIQRTIPTVGAPPLNIAVTLLRNAAEAKLFGTELELIAEPFPGLQLASTMSTFKSRYTEFDLPGAPVNANFANIKDASLPAQPDYLMSFSANYDLDVDPLGTLQTRVQWTHRGAQANDTQDSRSIRSSKYGLLDAYLSLGLPDGQTDIALFGSNLLNRRYTANGVDLSESIGLALLFEGAPRRYGVEIRRRF